MNENFEGKSGWIFLLAFLFVFAFQISGQVAEQSAPLPNQTREDNNAGVEVSEAEAEFILDAQPAAVKRNFSTWHNVVLTRKDKLAVSMHPPDALQFANFLEQDGAGFVRLYDAATCESNFRILNVGDECPPNMRGRGAFYSFRQRKYQTRLFADVKFYKDFLQVTGLNVLGFLVEPGDRQLDELTLQSGGVREMSEFAPSDDLEQIKIHYRAVVGGFRIGDFLYKSSLPLKENNTYALRAVAYQGKVVGQMGRFKVNVLSRDKRQDVIIAFRVIRRHENGSVSLLWRELQRKAAPKLDFEKKKNESEK